MQSLWRKVRPRLCVYAPTLIAQPEVKGLFYAALAQVVESVLKSEKLILLGDSNVRVGNDNESWPDTIGAFGIGKINDNGQRLLELSAKLKLCVANTYKQCKEHHKVSWMHPSS